MSEPLSFRFFLADRNHPVRAGDPIAANPIPCSRSMPPEKSVSGESSALVTYGDYFHAIRDFIQKDPARTLCRACADSLGYLPVPEEIERVDVFLAKHGEFYHPCRMVTVAARHTIELALNGAVSPNGREAIEGEYSHLNRLGKDFPFDFLPRVYAIGSGCDAKKRPIPMFLAQWFSGYHECHLSRPNTGVPARMRVWTGDGREHYLTPFQTANFHRRCSLILTSYYHPLTTEHIFPWHHAAGDFVVSRDAQGIDVRLVTARDYQPLLAPDAQGIPPGDDRTAERRVMQGLLIFFLAMSLRMRLDRREGVGEILWAPVTALAGAVDGFFQGLALISLHHGLPEGMCNYFRRFLLSHSEQTLADLCRKIADRYPPASEERRVVRRHATRHAAALRRRVAAAPLGPTS